MPLSPNTSVVLPKNEVVIGICPGNNDSFTGNWPQARTDLETWWNTGGASGHRFKMLHGIVGTQWSSGSYYSARTLWQGIPSDVQPLISIPSMYPTGVSGTYDLALGTTYDSQFQTVWNQVAADYPYSSIRIGQEIDGNWFEDGYGNAATNKATPQKIADLHAKHSKGLRAAGWKGTYEVNAGSYNGFNIASILDLMDPTLWDVATCDAYGERNGLTDSQTTAWSTKQGPMIQNAIAMAAKYGKSWGMSEWGPVQYVDGSPDYGCDDDPYYFQQVRKLAVDPTQPHCAYLCLFNGNDYNKDSSGNIISMHRRDAMANPASTTSGPWSSDSHFPNAITEFKSSNWTPSGLTVTTGGGSSGAQVLPRPRGRRRHTSMIFG